MRHVWLAAAVLGSLVALCACDAPAQARDTTPRVQAVTVAMPLAVAAAAPVAPTPATPPTAAAQPSTGAPAASGDRPTLQSLGSDRAAWQALLARVPELASFASSFVPFGAKAADEALARGKRSRGSITVWSIADGPLAWSPQPARELWVASGSVGERALIAVLAPQNDGSVRHEASLVIDDKDAQVALASSVEHPDELLWSTCYACPGEGGSIRLGDDGRARFVYR